MLSPNSTQPRRKRRFRFAWSRFATVGFGLERIGLLAHRYPRSAAIVLGLLVVVAIYGMFHVSVDRNLRDMFRGGTETYQTYLEAAAAYADLENQVLILIEAEEPPSPEVLARLLDLHLDLQLLPEVDNTYSLFSLRGPPDERGITAPVVGDLSRGLDADLIESVRSHPILGQSLLSADGRTLLISVSRAEHRPDPADIERLIEDVDNLLPVALAGTGVTATVTGLAAVRNDIVSLIKRDQLVLNGAGLLVGFVLSFLFFRSWVGSLMTAVPAAIAGITLIGWPAAFGMQVTIVSDIVPLLIMVLGYADGMHLTHAWRRARDRGFSAASAERRALLESAAPCMLTALTMAIAFLSMTISDVGIVSDFGWTGAIGTITGTAIVLAGHALAGRFLGRFWRVDQAAIKTPLGWLAEPTAAVTRWVSRFAWPFAIISVPLTIVCGALFLAVPPEHSVRATLPSTTPAAQALSTIDDELGGAFPVQVIIPISAEAQQTPEGLARIRAVHEAVNAVPGVRSALSLWSLAEWLSPDIEVAAGRVADLFAGLPDETRSRFYGAPGALVTVNISELSTVETLALVDQIEEAAVRAAPEAFVTGATVVGARDATATINGLNTSLSLAIVGALVLIAIALRSVTIGLVAFIPNVLPDMATGSVLYFLGDGMQLTAVVGLTIAFGIAIDDSIHYLNVFFRHRAMKDVRERLARTAREVGPVLIATTLVIVAGLVMTLTSGLNTVKMFGLIISTALVLAAIGDIVFLPAIIAGPARRWLEKRQAARQQAPAAASGTAAGKQDMPVT